jgi:predicted phage terminase large subunit-like protein
MLSGRKPNHSTLMEGTGDDLVQSFYKGCLEYLDAESEYHFYDIFPNAKLVQTYADRKTFNLDKKSRFPTVMCRSIDARQVGLSEATNLLYLDDCVEGREEAKNRQRLDDKWEVISGDIIGRAIEGTPIVICGTRYSLYDPIGRLQETARKSGWKWKAIETPALDPVTDETNFEYMRDGKPVFTTAFFREQREILCAEQWESEFQQQPFEAKGLLFNKDELNYFFELPVGREPDTIFAACDTADKGADFTSMPIVAIYDQEAYLIDVVFDDAPPTVTKPECAKALRDNHVASAVFESNNAGSYFARDVEQLLKGMGYTCSIRTKRTISNKETRIEFASDNIIKKFYFRHPSTYKAGSQYDQFFKQLTTYVRQGKVPHDDAPDSLAMLENEIRMRIGSRIEVVSRTF